MCTKCSKKLTRAANTSWRCFGKPILNGWRGGGSLVIIDIFKDSNIICRINLKKIIDKFYSKIFNKFFCKFTKKFVRNFDCRNSLVSEALTSTFYLNDFEDVSFHDGIRRSRELNIVPQNCDIKSVLLSGIFIKYSLRPKIFADLCRPGFPV